MIDEVQTGRHQARQKLADVLRVPLDPEEAQEYHRDRWGADTEALSELEAQEAWLDEFTVG
jgi:hypothetical protein